MAEWRLLRGWSDAELEAGLERARQRAVSFSESPEEMRRENGWRHYFSEAEIGREPPGAPVAGGAFERAWGAITRYEFSDPRIVTAHFDPDEELLGRRMLLEIHVLGLRYLGGVRVGAVRQEERDGRTVHGFRYDTLDDHIESGAEWFLLSKDHRSGEVWFRIQADWRPGTLPNWWSELGFNLLVRRYQRAWHRLAYLRLREAAGTSGLPPLPRQGRLVHYGRKDLSAPSIQRLGRKHASERTREEVGGFEHELRELESLDKEEGLR